MEVRMTQSSSGMTLVEVLIALIVLGVGIVALAGSSSMVSRMIGRGKAETHAALAASRRMETLRSAAASTTPRCTAPSFASGGPLLVDGVTETWVVPPGGAVRRIRVTVSYLTVRGTRSAILETQIAC
jgi:prepilin-type N-terminal cleavage/methylation domain-containing protein